jgi:hypothetical protein
MWSKLGLTDKQKDSVYSTRAEYRAKIDELHKQIQQLEKAEQAELQKILTDAQRARLKELYAEKAQGVSGSKEDRKPDSKSSDDKKP